MAVQLDPERVAVTEFEGVSVTAGQLADLARRAASRFETGTHVAYCAGNCLALPVALFGSSIARRPFLPLNYRLSDEQLKTIVGTHDLVAVADPANAERLRKAGCTAIIDNATLVTPQAMLGGSPEDADPDGVALLLYTSGTTAEPKGAILRHRHLAAYVIATVDFGAASSDEAALVSVPPYHVAGVMNLLTNLYAARRIVYLDRFDALRWLECVRAERVTQAMVVPTMLSRIVDLLDDAEADTPSLRALAYGGARMPPHVLERALRAFSGAGFANAYGLTETSSTIAVLGPDDHRTALTSRDPSLRARLRSVGKPVPGIEVQIRDASGGIASTYEAGDIVVRGEQIAGEYLDDSTKESDWFATRDRGYLDADGYLFIEGRADDTIIRGGENIAPAEIEDVLLQHGSVSDCAVVGIDDDEWGQRLAAAVVPGAGELVDVDDLREFAKARLRSAKTPDTVTVVETLPYTETGKLLRRVVREQLQRRQADMGSASPLEKGTHDATRK